jgi:hypothetical protein
VGAGARVVLRPRRENPTKELEVKVFMEREVRSLSGGKAWIKLIPEGFQIRHFKNHTFQTEGCTFKFPFKSDMLMKYLESVKKNVKCYEEAA